MNRRNFLISTTALSSSFLLSSFNERTTPGNKLSVLYTNDVHSRIEPFPDNHPKFAGRGGFSARAAMIDAIRREGSDVLLLDAGDIFQGTPYFNYYGGELEFKLMSLMGYDAATLGNHDFDNGVDGLLKVLPNASFIFINSNYDFSQSMLRDKIHRYRIFKKAGIKIGVYGLGVNPDGLIPQHLIPGIHYTDPLEAALAVEKELLEKGCTLIICLSHIGYTYEDGRISDSVLAPQLFHTHLIIGGHTHTFLDKPQSFVNKSQCETLVTQVGWAGLNLGRVDYLIDTKKGASNPDCTMMKISKKTI
jgi:5'-nucleotidase